LHLSQVIFAWWTWLRLPSLNQTGRAQAWQGETDNNAIASNGTVDARGFLEEGSALLERLLSPDEGAAQLIQGNLQAYINNW
jgi:hypothetical protein